MSLDPNVLVEGLNSLLDGESAVSALIACGPAAIEPLRRFLLEGRPSGVYQPRRWAVDALAGLGAKDILLEYLTSFQLPRDAEVRFGEEAVRNAAARHLASWRSEDVFHALLAIALPHPMSGIVEALGSFHRTEALPYFLQALEDDFCREAAAGALRDLGPDALPALLGASLLKIPGGALESPSSQRRRAACVQILSQADLPAGYWDVLRPLLEDAGPEIAVALTPLALRYGTPEDRLRVFRCLVAVLSAADWFGRMEIEDCLVSLCPEHQIMLEEEIERGNRLPPLERVQSNALRTLLRVKRRVLEATGRDSA
jgi:hypothetical protein